MITVRPPGDKSISHRAVLLATVATGPSSLRGLGNGEDVRSSLGVAGALGAEVAVRSDDHGLSASITPGAEYPTRASLDCGNSGTTARLAAGLVVGIGAGARFDGDASLRARPMRRVVYPLQAMGARIEYAGEPDRLPFAVASRATGSLRVLRHRPRVASAQVKSALLFAGVLDSTLVEVLEPAKSRDHTERMLAACGAPIQTADGPDGHRVTFDPDGWTGGLAPIDLDIPGDPSSAAFMIGAGLLTRRTVRVEGVSANPTRTAFLEVLETMGATIERVPTGSGCGEPGEDWVVEPPDRLTAFEIGGKVIPALIDEIPLLVALAARADGRSVVRDAAELRVKESDRLDRLARNLEQLGVKVSETTDGLAVEGTAAPIAGRIEPRGDHRVSMAFAVLGTSGGARLEDAAPECRAVSYPGFDADLARFSS